MISQSFDDVKLTVNNAIFDLSVMNAYLQDGNFPMGEVKLFGKAFLQKAFSEVLKTPIEDDFESLKKAESIIYQNPITLAKLMRYTHNEFMSMQLDLVAGKNLNTTVNRVVDDIINSASNEYAAIGKGIAHYDAIHEKLHQRGERLVHQTLSYAISDLLTTPSVRQMMIYNTLMSDATIITPECVSLGTIDERCGSLEEYQQIQMRETIMPVVEIFLEKFGDRVLAVNTSPTRQEIEDAHLTTYDYHYQLKIDGQVKPLSHFGDSDFINVDFAKKMMAEVCPTPNNVWLADLYQNAEGKEVGAERTSFASPDLALGELQHETITAFRLQQAIKTLNNNDLNVKPEVVLAQLLVMERNAHIICSELDRSNDDNMSMYIWHSFYNDEPTDYVNETIQQGVNILKRYKHDEYVDETLGIITLNEMYNKLIDGEFFRTVLQSNQTLLSNQAQAYDMEVLTQEAKFEFNMVDQLIDTVAPTIMKKLIEELNSNGYDIGVEPETQTPSLGKR